MNKAETVLIDNVPTSYYPSTGLSSEILPDAVFEKLPAKYILLAMERYAEQERQSLSDSYDKIIGAYVRKVQSLEQENEDLKKQLR